VIPNSLILIAISTFLVSCSLAVPRRIHGPIPVGFTIPFGYPVTFVWQDNIYDPPYGSYWYFFKSPLGSPTRVSRRLFMLDVALVFMPLYLLSRAVRHLSRRRFEAELGKTDLER
jgi:hypothetical protein